MKAASSPKASLARLLYPVNTVVIVAVILWLADVVISLDALPRNLTTERWQISLVLRSALTLLALFSLSRIAKDERSTARGFWIDLSVAVGSWWPADILLSISAHGGGSSLRLMGLGALTCTYAFTLLAVARRPHSAGPWRPERLQRRLHLLGVVVFVAGCLGYFTILPGLDRSPTLVGAPTNAAFMVLSWLAAGRLGMSAYAANDASWRRVYSLLAIAASLPALVHSDAMLAVWRGAGRWLDVSESVLISTTLLLALLTARSQAIGQRARAGVDAFDHPVVEASRGLETFFLALTVGVPLMHYGGHIFGFFTATLEPARELLMVAWVLALGTVTIFQQRMLESRMSDQLAERRKIESRLASSQQRLQLMEHRRQSADLLFQTREKYRKAFRSSPYAVLISTLAEGRCLDCNDRFCELLGYERDQVIGKTTLELRIWVFPQEREKALAKLQQDQVLYDFPMSYRTHSGAQHPALVSARPFESEDEPCMLTVTMDLTELINKRKATQQIAGLLDQLPHPVWIFDESHQVIDRNRCAAELQPPASRELEPILRTTASEGHWHGTLEGPGPPLQAWCSRSGDRHGLAPPRLILLAHYHDLGNPM